MNRQALKKLAIVLAILALIWLVLIQHGDLQSPSFALNLMSVNEAQFSHEWTKHPIDDEGKLHLITNIVLVTHKNYSYNLLYGGDRRPPTMKELTERQQEIERCLQADLNHPKVAAIHILYTHPDVLSYLRKLKMENTKKMVLHFSERDPTVGVNLKYIQKYLKNKYIVLKHQDNFLGEGWEDFDLNILSKNNIAYALTRHVIRKDAACSPTSSCHDGAQYIGSHDAFVMYVNRNFPEPMLKEMDIVPSAGGMENVMIWYFREIMKYKVTNPCKTLKVYHVHCVPIREKNRKRYNNNGKSGLAGYTADLL